MNGRRRSGPRFLVAGALQHSQHLQNSNAAGAGRRRGDDFVIAIVAAQRRALDGLVLLQIVEGDQSAVGLHRGSEFVGDFSFVEIAGALVANALQSSGQLRLRQRLAVMRSQEDPLRLRKLREKLVVEGPSDQRLRKLESSGKPPEAR